MRGDLLRSVSHGLYRGVLELVAYALRRAAGGFPDVGVTEFLREAYQADFAGAGSVDLRGTDSHTWADSPAAIPVDAGGFHQYAAAHPLCRAYQQLGRPVPLRLSDLPAASALPAYGGTDMSRVLAIPLAIGPQRQCAIALLRAGPDFTAADLELASQLQPVFGGLYDLGRRADVGGARCAGPVGADTGIPLSDRELAVLDLAAGGLITAAIARQLGISPRTVGKHLEKAYRKLGTNDRVSAVLRAQSLGLVPVAAQQAVQFPAGVPGQHAVSHRPRERSADQLPIGEAPAAR